MIAKSKAQLLLHLDEDIFLLGGKMTGELKILSHESFEAEEIRLSWSATTSQAQGSMHPEKAATMPYTVPNATYRDH